MNKPEPTPLRTSLTKKQNNNRSFFHCIIEDLPSVLRVWTALQHFWHQSCFCAKTCTNCWFEGENRPSAKVLSLLPHQLLYIPEADCHKKKQIFEAKFIHAYLLYPIPFIVDCKFLKSLNNVSTGPLKLLSHLQKLSTLTIVACWRYVVGAQAHVLAKVNAAWGDNNKHLFVTSALKSIKKACEIRV